MKSAQITSGKPRARFNADGGQYGIVITGARSFVTISYIEVFGCRHTATATGLYKATGAGSSIIIERCVVHNVLNSNGSAGACGIKGFADNSILRNNVVYDMGDDGVYWEGDNVEIAYNQIFKVSQNAIGGDCIQLADTYQSTSNFWVHHNTLDHSDRDYKQCFIVTSGGAGGPSSGGRFEFNRCVGFDGAAENKPVYVDSASVVVRGNVISGGIRSIDLPTNSNGAIVTGNVIRNAGNVANTTGVIFYADNIQIENNTIIGQVGTTPTVTTVALSHFNAGDTGCVVKNNIVTGWNYGLRYNTSAGLIEQYNNFSDNTNNTVNNSYLPVSSDATDTNYSAWDYITSDSSLKPGDNPLATSGTYVPGVTLANGRLRPGFAPIGAYQAVVPRAARA